MSDQKRMAGDFVVIQSMFIGDKEKKGRGIR